MKRGVLFVLLVFLLLVGCEQISSVLRPSHFTKYVTVLEIDESVGGIPGLPEGLDEIVDFSNIPGFDSFMEDAPDSAEADIKLGNFWLDVDLKGNMEKWSITKDGQAHTITAYRLDGLDFKVNPDVFMSVDVSYGDARFIDAPDITTRVKLLEVRFVKYTSDGNTVMYSKAVSGMDTGLGGIKTIPLSFGGMYVPPNFEIIMLFDVGEEGPVEATIHTPATIQGYVPMTVTWQPFPNEGNPAELSVLNAVVEGSVFDGYNGQLIVGDLVDVNYAAGGAHLVLTDSNGYYSVEVPLEADEHGDIYQVPYDVLFDGCDYTKSKCSRTAHAIHELFREQGISDFDYGPGRVNYPSADNYLFVEGNNGNLYWRHEPFSGTLASSGEHKQHVFYMVPAPPGAYLKANRTSVVKNEVIKFEGFSAKTYASVDKWEIDFGDGSAVQSGSGAAMTATHAYSSAGDYSAKVRFGSSSGAWSPWYQKKISVGKVLPVAYIDSIEPAQLNLSKKPDGTIVPGSFVIRAHGVHPEGSQIVSWERMAPFQRTGTGASFVSNISITGGGTYEIKVRFKDEFGVWSEWVSKNLTVSVGEALGDLAVSLSTVPQSKTIIKGHNMTFIGQASKFGGSVVKYQWDPNGDGIFEYVSQQATAVDYFFKDPGTYVSRLVVTDETGATASANVTVRVLDVSVDFNMGGGNTANEGDSITMSSTLYNLDPQADIAVQQCSMAWYQYNNGQYNFWHYEVAFANACQGIGSVHPRNNKVLWKETETVCCPGKQKVVIQVQTQYGIVETSFLKTVNHVDLVNLSSTQNSCNIPGTINLLVSSNMINTNCNLELSLNNGPWVASGSAITDNTGYLYFTPSCTTPGNYRARAVCGSATSNVFSFAAVGQQQPPPPQPPDNETPQPPPQPVTEYSGTVELRTNRPEYSQAKLFAGEEVILYLLSSSELPTGAKCDLYVKYTGLGNDWSKLGVIPTAQHSGSFRLGGQGLRINAGTWLAKAICKNLHTRETAYNVLGSFLPETSMPNPHVPEGFEPQSVPSKSGTDASASSSSFGKLTGRSRLTSRAVSDVDGSFFAAEVLFLSLLGLVVIACFFVFRKE